MHPALFYRPGDRLTLAELSAARLDGVVIEVGEGFMPVDTVEEADARALGVAMLIPRGTAACGPTAAWIHGAGDAPPAVHHIRRVSAARMRVTPRARVIYHDRRAAQDAVADVGGIPVTTPEATASELLYAAALDQRDDHWVNALLQARPELLGSLEDELARATRRPGRRAAAQLLQAVRASQDVVTR